jgi:hypothetical protein
MYIVGKYKIYLYKLKKQVEKRACFIVSGNELYIFRQYSYILYILQC